ncbi:hypothetical protein RRG08_056596 [Elysia crispata]|uniref:G8 domain-containing protein n=1 Tax=Elysia crispata TaxID=231223 RepID=A0AAE0Z690_9GAST|nr:hypothetical protein RRG08_056596 [Elysia crispata]
MRAWLWTYLPWSLGWLLYRTTSSQIPSRRRHPVPLTAVSVVVVVVAVVAALLTPTAAQTQCPDYIEDSCDRWSDSTTWTNDVVPGEGDVVDIDKCILLDTTTANLGGITIQPTGSLVFEPGIGNQLKVRTKYIRVEGLLRIGSEQCRYEGKATIELTGNRGDHTDSDFGQKYIGVASGGRLELHGERKMPWVKLNQTLDTPDTLEAPYFDSKKDAIEEYKSEGIVAVVINPENGLVRAAATFNVGTNSRYWFGKDEPRFVSFMDWIPANHVVMLASQKTALSSEHNTTSVLEALEKAIYCKVGRSRLRSMQPEEVWVAIAVKEQPWRTQERVGRDVDKDGFRHAQLDLMMPWLNAAFYVSSKKHYTWRWYKDTRLLAGTYDELAPVLDTTGDVRSWKHVNVILETARLTAPPPPVNQ